ncbi:hypothetical protein C7401_107292 [Paraburkholderia unamae]|nr:hypothetical protein C7401_107292 [Paraburkholderia unamae]
MGKNLLRCLPATDAFLYQRSARHHQTSKGSRIVIGLLENPCIEPG